MKCVGVFAGVGGLELGLQSGGFETELLCEILPEAQAVLRCNFPEVPIVDDIKRIKSLPQDISLICGGFPCQDLSSVGKKRGIEGLQSSLVNEVFRLIKKERCEWVLLENVKFMLHLDKGLAMKHITEALEDLGYKWSYRVMNSQNFGVPQRRERVYILASKNYRPESVLFRDPLGVISPILTRPVDLTFPIGFYWTEGRYSTGLAHDALPPIKGGSTIGIPSPPAILFPSGLVGTPDIRDVERMQGFPENWTACAEDVVKPGFRWRLVGNAATVGVCKWIAQGIAEYEEFPVEHNKHTGSKWPNAAFGSSGNIFEVQGAHGPCISSSLSTFLNFPIKPLSYRAVTGFIKRAKTGNLKFPEKFIDSLTKYSESL